MFLLLWLKYTHVLFWKGLFFLSSLEKPLGHLKIDKDVYGQRSVWS